MRINYQKYHEANEKAISLQAVRDELSERLKTARLGVASQHAAVSRGLQFGLTREAKTALGVYGRDASEFHRRLVADPNDLAHLLAINADPMANSVGAYAQARQRVERLELRFAQVDAEHSATTSLVRRMADFIYRIDGALPA
jgi:hypothetical protein